MRRFAPLLSLCLLLGTPLPAPAHVLRHQHAAPVAPAAARPAADATLAGLAPGSRRHGFRAEARYRGDGGTPIGARFVHEATGFTLDVLRIQSTPQAFIWVNTWPTSDMGEPHTQEHLLLGKGNRGRRVATLDNMALTETSAYTEQRRTVYQFATAAGPEVYHELLERRLDALLHPDYTDEEVRREVRNFGVADGPAGPRLEEQGTVYNEMSSTYERPWTRLFRRYARALYGQAHPMSFDAGGTPEALRRLGPADIRAFHRANYHLGNMGMIASLPAEMPVDGVLRRFDGMLRRLEPRRPAGAGAPKRDADLPPFAPARAGHVEVMGYPNKNAADPGHLLIGWPATNRFADGRERLMAELFAGAFAGDATTTLYKRFIDSKTRTADLGATDVSAWFDDDFGHAFAVAFSDMAVQHLTPARIAGVRTQVKAELQRVAGWKAGDAALADFNQRVLALLRGKRRALAKFVDSPPGFGFRSTYSGWMRHLDQLAEAPGFEKAVTLDADLAAAERLLARGGNPWRERIEAWGLIAATPIAVAVKPEPGMVKAEEAAKKARLAAETARLKRRFRTKDATLALKKYRAEFDARTASLKRIEAAGPARRFLAKPPMGRDPGLAWRQLTTARGVPVVASTFDTMGGASTGLVLRADAVPAERLMYLSLLPKLLTEVGVIVDGKPISHEEVTRRLRTEILDLDAYFSRNGRTKRCELVLRGSGNTGAEAARAIAWMRHMAFTPDWRPANLPRLRDVVDQRAAALQQRMKGAEEDWVRDPAGAFRRQEDPLQLATGSFLTMAHYAQRLRWQLRDAGSVADRAALTAFLDALAGAPAKAGRPELAGLATALTATKGTRPAVAPALAAHVAAFDALPAGARAHAAEAARDLGLAVADLPDATLAADWAYMCGQIRDDLLMPPAEALAALEATRHDVFAAAKARMFVVGSKARQDQLLAGPVPALVGGLAGGPGRVATYARTGLVSARLRERHADARPVFVGLVAPSTQSGVFVDTAPGTAYADEGRDALLDFLASKLYGGGGAHSIFMKTWGAGLAYSNGLSGSPESGEMTYYAERCPELPQTLTFVIDEIKKAKRDPALVEYAYALAFDDSRASWSYEARGEAMAADLADGVTPSVVRRFRERLLALRNEPGLTNELFGRMPATYGRLLPGLYGKASDVAGATYFVIGPEKQLAAYERYLKGVEGPDTTLYRLYPRDFWDVGRSARP